MKYKNVKVGEKYSIDNINDMVLESNSIIGLHTFSDEENTYLILQEKKSFKTVSFVECDIMFECISTDFLSVPEEVNDDNKQKLVDSVIEKLKIDFEFGDYTVLNELLKFIPNKHLIQSLDEI